MEEQVLLRREMWEEMPKAPGRERDLVVLITRMETINAGNQALSSALIELATGLYPGHEVVPLERRPAALEAFSLTNDAGPDEAVTRSFRQCAERLVAMGPDNGAPASLQIPAAKEPRLVSGERSMAQRALGRARRIATGLIHDDARRGYVRRLGLYRRAALVIANPAGEFDPSGSPDIPAQLMLDLFVARQCGARTAIVNHSVEVRDQRLKRLISETYPEFDAVVCRDEQSKQTLAGLGLAPEGIRVAPDLALILDLGLRAEMVVSGRVGIALNPHLINLNQEMADDIVGLVSSRSKELTFVSNCWKKDQDLARYLRSKWGMNLQSGALEFRRYARLLSKFDFVVSSRLHTIVLGILCGIPVIPLETQMHRISGLMAAIGYPLRTVHTGERDWRSRLADEMDRIVSHRDEISDEVYKVATRAKELTRTSYYEILSSVLTPEVRSSYSG